MNDDEPTRRIYRSPGGQQPREDEPTRILGRNPGQGQPDDETVLYEDTKDIPTMEITGRNSDLRTSASNASDEQTILFRPKPKVAATGVPDHTLQPTPDHAKRPVVGWLVVVGGPGAGNSHVLGHGVNQIGRDASQQVALNYGDQQISRQGHAAITYDPKGRKFYIQQGSGSALAYLNDQPVLQPCLLEAGSVINLGDTNLAFVPFCGPEFDWNEVL